MAPWVALALVGLLLGATNLRAARGESFNYDLSGTDWPGLCQTGKKQSPINIVTSAVKRADGPSLLSREITVTNEEHAAGTMCSRRCMLLHAGPSVPLPCSRLASQCPPPLLIRPCAQVPSIHLVDGVQAPMEAKWTHGRDCSHCCAAPSNQPAVPLPSLPLTHAGAQHPPGGRRAGAHGGQVRVPSIHLVNGVQAPMEAKFAYVPSIHLVNGVQAPMEAKFAYVNVANTTRKSVFTVFLKLHPKDKDNAWLDLWLNDIPAAVNGTAKIAAKTNFLELLSFDSAFWYYEGSQVHPPCTETVDWFVSMRPKLVSTRQLATYMNFLSRTNSGDRTNNRLPQPLNDRTVSVFRAS
ncbi:unnamed protein product [Closterium sp. NIES-65]|nr:unnamed protein product [Closterium sp. NIES-65]